MIGNGDDDPGIDSVEKTAFSIEGTGISNEEKLDRLINIAANVRYALNRRTAIITVAIAVPLIVGALLLYHSVVGTRENKVIARLAYVQALENSRDNIKARIESIKTRDCPVVYFRELVETSRSGGDITAVNPPCELGDVNALERQLTDVEGKLAEERVK